MREITESIIMEARANAERYYDEGGLLCSEAAVKAILDAVCEEYPKEAIAMASGFPGGIGGSGCLCGALAGGVLTLGLLYGRSEPDSNGGKLARICSGELQSKFIERNKFTCCRALTKRVKGTPEHKIQCVRLTGEVVEDTLRLIKGDSQNHK